MVTVETTGSIVGIGRTGVGSGHLKVTAEVAGRFRKTNRIFHVHWYTDGEPPPFGSPVSVTLTFDNGGEDDTDL